MLNRVILWSLENRLAILTLAALLFVFGVRTAMQAPLDVFPDFAPPQVVIQTEAPGMSAEEVEQLLTVPLETELNGTANLETIRSSSIAGLSVVTCVFQPGTDTLQARQLVSEKLQLAGARLPSAAGTPQMMPISSPVGIILKISLTSETVSPTDLRTIADWTIRPRLLAVPGIANVTIFGGEVKQYQKWHECYQEIFDPICKEVEKSAALPVKARKVVTKVHDDTLRAGKIWGQANANYAKGHPLSKDAKFFQNGPSNDGWTPPGGRGGRGGRGPNPNAPPPGETPR